MEPEMANGETITIQGQTFRVQPRYAAGHQLKENEASALNQTYFENLRNNFAKKVSDGLEAGTGLDVLQQQLDDYAAEYEFGARTGGGGFRGDPVMTYAMGISREMVRNAIKAKGLNLDDYPASKITQTARALIDSQGPDGKIVTTAREQVAREKAAASEAMAEIGEILDQQSGSQQEAAA
jgi:hypothetical protein